LSAFLDSNGGWSDCERYFQRASAHSGEVLDPCLGLIIYVISGEISLICTHANDETNIGNVVRIVRGGQIVCLFDFENSNDDIFAANRKYRMTIKATGTDQCDYICGNKSNFMEFLSNSKRLHLKSFFQVRPSTIIRDSYLFRGLTEDQVIFFKKNLLDSSFSLVLGLLN
jgi:hypothetical protein